MLLEAGLNRPRGGGSRKPPQAEELEFGGGIFFQLADEVLGYSKTLTEAISVVGRTVPEPDPCLLETESEGRDEDGRFTAAYNEARSKDAPHGLGPAFRSVDEKRRETDLRKRRAVKESPATIGRKVKALLSLPLLTDAGKTVSRMTDRRPRLAVRLVGWQRCPKCREWADVGPLLSAPRVL